MEAAFPRDPHSVGETNHIIMKQIKITLESQAKVEKCRSQQWKVFKLLESHRLIHQLPLGVDRKKLEDELVRVSEEIVVLTNAFTMLDYHANTPDFNPNQTW